MNDIEEEYDEELDSWNLLNAVNHFDEIRTVANDSDICRPPEFRIKLLELHQKAMSVKNTDNKELLYEFSTELEELSSIASELQLQAEKLNDILINMGNAVDKKLGDYQPE